MSFAAAKILHLWSRLRSTYWFVPSLILAGCVGLSYAMLWIDYALPPGYVIRHAWVYTRDPNGARDLLSVVSQSMITVAGVVFSVTVVALALASNQFGTRVLKSFARDVGNQIVLGTFLGTFLYGILVMRRIESLHTVFVPSLSVAVAIALAMFSLLVLVYFIHHVIVEIQGENVVAAVARDLYVTMDALFPEELGKAAPPAPDHLSASEASLIETAGLEVHSRTDGFIRAVNDDKLMRLARENDAVVRLLVMPGDFVSKGRLLARVWGPSVRQQRLEKKLQQAVSIGAQRSYEEDIGFGLQQLGLIAVRSLSPAINAVGTALDAIDRLIASLVRLGQRKIPSPYRRDPENRLRVITQPWDMERLLDGVLDPIRHAAGANPAMVMHIVHGLADAAGKIPDTPLRRLIGQHLERFAAAEAQFPQELDRRRLRELTQKLRERRVA